MNDAEFFCRELTKLREAQGMSKKALAEILNTNVPAISDWESGITSPRLINFIRWADALGYELDLHKKGSSL